MKEKVVGLQVQRAKGDVPVLVGFDADDIHRPNFSDDDIEEDDCVEVGQKPRVVQHRALGSKVNVVEVSPPSLFF